MALVSKHRGYVRSTLKPDPTAFRQLNAYFSSLMPRSNGHPYTKEHALRLGKLYRQVWGKAPSPSRMKKDYCLPDALTIKRLYGTYQAYYDDLEVSEENTSMEIDTNPFFALDDRPASDLTTEEAIYRIEMARASFSLNHPVTLGKGEFFYTLPYIPGSSHDRSYRVRAIPSPKELAALDAAADAYLSAWRQEEGGSGDDQT